MKAIRAIFGVVLPSPVQTFRASSRAVSRRVVSGIQAPNVRRSGVVADGLQIPKRAVIVALGLTTHTTNVSLGRWHGSTENTTVRTELLRLFRSLQCVSQQRYDLTPDQNPAFRYAYRGSPRTARRGADGSYAFRGLRNEILIFLEIRSISPERHSIRRRTLAHDTFARSVRNRPWRVHSRRGEWRPAAQPLHWDRPWAGPAFTMRFEGWLVTRGYKTRVRT